MARRATPADEYPAITDATFREVPQDEVELEEEADRAEQAFLDEFGVNDNLHEYYARIYRVVNGRKNFLEQVGTDKFPIEERLQTRWKGGHFEAILFRDGKIWKTKTYRVEALPQEERQTQSSQIGEIAALIAQQNEQFANLLTRGTVAPQAPADPMQMFTGMMAAIASMKEVFASPQPSSPFGGLKDVMEVLTFAREFGGDHGNNDEGIAGIIRELIKSPITGELAESIRAQRNEQGMQQRHRHAIEARPAVQLNAPRADQNPQQQQAGVPPLLAMMDQQTIAVIKHQVDTWIAAAKRDSDPGLYAELACDQFPVEFLSQLVAQPDLEAIATALNPEAPAVWPWLSSMISEINLILTEPGDPEDKGGEADPGPDVFSAPVRPQSAAVGLDGDPVGRGGSEDDAKANGGTRKGGKGKPANSSNGRPANKRSTSKELDG